MARLVLAIFRGARSWLYKVDGPWMKAERLHSSFVHKLAHVVEEHLLVLIQELRVRRSVLVHFTFISQEVPVPEGERAWLKFGMEEIGYEVVVHEELVRQL